MSHIAKALNNFNYGSNFADNIISAVNQFKQKDALNKYIGLMQQAQQNMNQAYQPQRKTVLGFKNPEMPIANTTQRNLTSLNNNQLPVTQAPTSNQMPSYQQEQPVDYNEANRQAINTVMDFINKSLPLQKDLPQGMTQQGLSALEMLRGANQPKPHTYKNITPGGMEVELDEFGRPTGNVIQNPKEWDKSRVETETNEDGTPKIYNKGGKQYLKEITTDPTGHKSSTFKPVPNAPKTTINAGDETRAEKKKIAQTKYDAIMNSQWFTKDQLKSQGFNTDGLNYDGAYVSPDGKLFYTDQSLKNYALKESPGAVNQWDKKGFEDQIKRITDKGYSRDEAINLIRQHEGK